MLQKGIITAQERTAQLGVAFTDSLHNPFDIPLQRSAGLLHAAVARVQPAVVRVGMQAAACGGFVGHRVGGLLIALFAQRQDQLHIQPLVVRVDFDGPAAERFGLGGVIVLFALGNLVK